MCLKNGFVAPAKPCCFAAAEPSFLAGSWCCGGINQLFNGVWAWGCHDLRPKHPYPLVGGDHGAFQTLQRIVDVGKRSHDRCTVYQIYVDAAVVSLLPTSAFFGILSGGRRHWAAALKSGCAVAPENLALLRGGPDPAADPPFGRYLRLAGHWWEQKRLKLETRRPLGGAKKQQTLRQRI